MTTREMVGQKQYPVSIRQKSLRNIKSNGEETSMFHKILERQIEQRYHPPSPPSPPLPQQQIKHQSMNGFDDRLQRDDGKEKYSYNPRKIKSQHHFELDGLYYLGTQSSQQSLPPKYMVSNDFDTNRDTRGRRNQKQIQLSQPDLPRDDSIDHSIGRLPRIVKRGSLTEKKKLTKTNNNYSLLEDDYQYQKRQRQSISPYKEDNIADGRRCQEQAMHDNRIRQSELSLNQVYSHERDSRQWPAAAAVGMFNQKYFLKSEDDAFKEKILHQNKRLARMFAQMQRNHSEEISLMKQREQQTLILIQQQQEQIMIQNRKIECRDLPPPNFFLAPLQF